MPGPYVVVGYSADLLADLDALMPPGSVIVVEEPDVIETRHVRECIGEVSCLGQVVAAPTQDEANADRLISLIRRPAGTQAIIPANDYGVVAAATLAQAWGLPGAGSSAARVLRDKALLRQRAERAGVAQPAWRTVHSADEVAQFRADGDGTCVLKPTNRQASVGVQILEPETDMATAWALTAGAEERMFRPSHATNAGFLVERRMRGPEMSAEALVSNQEIVFFNATAKAVLPGRHPVEMGHMVPALDDDEVNARLKAGMRALVEVTGFASGALHGEWIIVDKIPHLVECGARLPGDCIVELIELAYDWSLLRGLVGVLSGHGVNPAPAPVRGAAIRFLSASPGRVVEVHGAREAAELDGVHDVLVRVSAADTVEPVISSWQRPGHVIATGVDGPHAARVAAEAVARITVDTVPLAETA